MPLTDDVTIKRIEGKLNGRPCLMCGGLSMSDDETECLMRYGSLENEPCVPRAEHVSAASVRLAINNAKTSTPVYTA